METDPFMELQERLSEVQMELSCRAWTDDRWTRCEQAGDLRMKLWEAICEYRDAWVKTVRGY